MIPQGPPPRPHDCPACGELMSRVLVQVSLGWSFNGFLCGKCRVIWSPTRIDEQIGDLTA